MPEPIPYLHVLEHERLCERLTALRRTVKERGAPDTPVSPMLAFAAADLLGDIYRLISREPGARALPRIDRRAPPTQPALAAMLLDARLALDAFAHRHRDHDGEHGGGWLTREALADCEGWVKIYPPPPAPLHDPPVPAGHAVLTRHRAGRPAVRGRPGACVDADHRPAGKWGTAAPGGLSPRRFGMASA